MLAQRGRFTRIDTAGAERINEILYLQLAFA